VVLKIVRILASSAVVCAWTAFSAPAVAQTCITPNCTFGGTPAACANRAAPRTPTVLMGGAAGLVFQPANPKIEPGDCIVWRSASVTHSSSGSACPDDSLCGSPAPMACQWDSANVSSASATPTATCFYDAERFPPTTAENYYCRVHASPTVGTMRGTLLVTTAIDLSVGKDLGTNSVRLSWSGGGVAGDVSYKVARQSGGDPSFPAASTVTVDPDGGVLGTTWVDPGALGDPATRFYLVRNKQANEI